MCKICIYHFFWTCAKNAQVPFWNIRHFQYWREIEKSDMLKITKTTSALHITFVTPWVLKFNANSSISNSCIEISDLFAAKSLAITPKKIELQPKKLRFFFFQSLLQLPFQKLLYVLCRDVIHGVHLMKVLLDPESLSVGEHWNEVFGFDAMARVS